MPFGPGIEPGFYGPGLWALFGPLWILFWVFLIGGLCFFFFRSRRGAWLRRGWGPGGPEHPAGPWGPQTGPEGEPLRPPEPPEMSLDRARAILHERYAKGDISTEEYRERIDNLV